MSTPPTDPLELLKTLWSGVGAPLPGLLTPTLDVNELDKRITDLKTVEGWLKTNLGMLQMTIQGLEVQRGTLAALDAMRQSLGSTDEKSNILTNPALWPWPLGGAMTKAAAEPAPKAAEPPPAAREKSPGTAAKPRGKPGGK
jgi:hypothetical protein